jgi:Transmembrane domain of unknown function (DUF3566)
MDAAVDPASTGAARTKKKSGDALPLTAASARLPSRRYRQTVQKLDLWSVLKLSLCFYLCGLIVTLLACVVLWVIADAFNVIHDIEHFMGDLLSSKDFKFLSAQILEGAILIGLVLVALMTIVTVIAAAFYNLFAELVGGVEVVIVEEDIGPRV